MTKKYTSVAEMAKALIDDEGFNNDLARHLARRQLVTKLTALRAARGLTQAEMAAKLGCTQGKVSKLEASEDTALNFGDVIGYMEALDVRLEMTFFRKERTIADRIKHHAFCIKGLTDQLARLAIGDAGIARAVASFFSETAFNLINMLQGSATMLGLPDEDAPNLVVETCGIEDGEMKPTPRGRRERRKALADS